MINVLKFRRKFCKCLSVDRRPYKECDEIYQELRAVEDLEDAETDFYEPRLNRGALGSMATLTGINIVALLVFALYLVVMNTTSLRRAMYKWLMERWIAQAGQAQVSLRL